MNIVSFIQDSFQEYENHQSLVLFSQGCNFNCRGCYNYDCVTKQESLGEAEDLINKLITPMHEAVVFLGGEPTIWNNSLLAAARVAKSKDLKVKVYSNGFLSNVIKKMNKEQIVDAWSIDLKCVKNTEEIIGTDCNSTIYLRMIDESISDICEHKLDIEIRTTLWPQVLEQQEIVKQVVSERFPNVRHIFQKDFNTNLKRIST